MSITAAALCFLLVIDLSLVAMYLCLKCVDATEREKQYFESFRNRKGAKNGATGQKQFDIANGIETGRAESSCSESTVEYEQSLESQF